MADQSLIQVRVDRPLKDDVSQIFAALGMDISTAVRIFFQRCRLENGIPFPLTIPQQKPIPKVKFGLAKGKWSFPEDWETQDKELDKEIAEDFYANPS